MAESEIARIASELLRRVMKSPIGYCVINLSDMSVTDTLMTPNEVPRLDERVDQHDAGINRLLNKIEDKGLALQMPYPYMPHIRVVYAA